MAETETLALVLGAGGARGMAHIGVIRTLEKHGYKIKAISGSSIGALIGGIHAMGKLDEYADWVCSLGQRDILQLADWSFSGAGLIQGTRVMDKLETLLGSCQIEEMDIQFTAVAVDLEQGKEIWFDKGSLFDAIRASIAIPGVFTPHTSKGKVLVDGGLLNPLPIAPTLRAITDKCFAVDLNALATTRYCAKEAPAPSRSSGNWFGKLRSLFEKSSKVQLDTPQVMIRALDIMQAQLTRQSLAVYTPDLVIPIPVDACAIYEFNRASELIALGEELTVSALAKLQNNT